MKRHILIRYVIGFMLIYCLPTSAQETTQEPVELVRLREQFQQRIDQEMKPWRDRYAQELQKLEDRLIKDRKLVEALAVKTEKENYLTASLEKKPEAAKNPDSAAEAKKFVTGTVWLVYASEDKKRENLLDVYYFQDDNQVFLMSARHSFIWSMKSKDDLAIQHTQSEIQIKVNFAEKNANAKLTDKAFSMFLTGKPAEK